MSNLLLLAAAQRFRQAGAPPAAPTVATVEVSGGTTSIVEGTSTQLVATVKDSAGNILAGRTVTWASDSASATVDGAGLVTGQTAGSANITATCEGVDSTPYALTVTAAPVLSASLTATAGDGKVTLTFSATNGTAPYTFDLYESATAGSLGAPLASGATSPYVDSGLTNGVARYYTDRVTDALGATADSPQRAATPGAGNALVTTVSITQPGGTSNTERAISVGGTYKYGVTLKGSDGKTVSGASATWTSSDETIATVDSTGLVTAGASKAGAVTITASCNGHSSSRKITVLSGIYTNDPAITAPSGISATTSINNAQFVEWTSGPAGRNKGVRVYYSTSPGVTTASPWQWLARRTGGARPQATPKSGLVMGLTFGATYYYRLSATDDDTAGESDLTPEQSFTVQADPGVVQPFWSADFETVDTQVEHHCGFLNMDLVDDATRDLSASAVGIVSDHSYTGTGSLRFTQPARDLCGDSSAEKDFYFGADLTELWIRFMLYVSNGTDGLGARYYHRVPYCAPSDPNGTISNNKFLALWPMEYNGHEVEVVYETRATALVSGGTDGDSYLYALRSGENDTNSQWGAQRLDDAITNVQRGRWVEVVLHVRTQSAPGVADGIVGASVDGRAFDNTGLNHLTPLSEFGNRSLRNGYLFGWSDSGFNEMTHFYVDEFRVYAHDPLL